VAEHKHPISGPGAADFLSAPGGEDRPETSADKGDPTVKGGSHFTDPRNLEPRLAPEDERPRAVPTGDREAPENITGSQSGTIGGGGPEAHNEDAVRATGSDDPTVEGGDAGS
jgi:hypothetical protein